MIIVALPVKDLASAKQRLVAALSPADRVHLARAMLADVLRALAGCRADAVWVVTRDAEAAAAARAAGADVVAEPENQGHTAAVARAQVEAERRGARVFATIPGDVPCLRSGEVDALVAAAGAAPSAVFVPSRSGLGTNGVALAPPAAMPLRFGEPSFADHVAEARRRGLEPRVLSLPGLGLDIDGPDDLAVLAAEGAGTESGRLAARWLAERRLPGPAPATRAC